MTRHSCTIEELKPLLGTPGWPDVIDVRIDEDRAAIPHTLPSARQCPHPAIADLPLWPGARYLVVCHKGLKISQGAAAMLRARGAEAAYLAGGSVGWQATGLPALPVSALRMAVDPPRCWAVSREPEPAALFGIWLVRRFIEPGARFLFVDPDQVHAVADRFNAEALDDPDIAERYGLHDARMAGTIRSSADHASLFAGLSAVHADPEMRATATLSIFDALYAEAGRHD